MRPILFIIGLLCGLAVSHTVPEAAAVERIIDTVFVDYHHTKEVCVGNDIELEEKYGLPIKPRDFEDLGIIEDIEGMI